MIHHFLQILADPCRRYPTFQPPRVGRRDTVPAQFTERKAPSCWRSLKGVYLGERNGAGPPEPRPGDVQGMVAMVTAMVTAEMMVASGHNN